VDVYSCANESVNWPADAVRRPRLVDHLRRRPTIGVGSVNVLLPVVPPSPTPAKMYAYPPCDLSIVSIPLAPKFQT
jgi:hypothetical protein